MNTDPTTMRRSGGSAVEWTTAARQLSVSQQSGPVRTCVGCRERVPAADLLRIIARKSESVGEQPAGVELLPDLRRRLTGRGAWLHPVPGCLHLAVKRRAFGRALRVSGNLDISAVMRLIEPDRAEHELYLEKNRHEHS